MGLKSLLRKSGLLDELDDLKKAIREGRKDVERSVKKMKKRLKAEVANLSFEEISQLLPLVAPGLAVGIASVRKGLLLAEGAERKAIMELLGQRVEALGQDKVVQLGEALEKKASDAIPPEVATLLAALKT